MALTVARGLGFSGVQWNFNRNDPQAWVDGATAKFNEVWNTLYAGRSHQLGYYPLEHFTLPIFNTAVGTYTSTYLDQILNHVIEPQGAHPGKTSAYLTGKMPVWLFLQMKSFNSNQAHGVFPDWGYSQHTYATSSGARSVPFFRNDNTLAPGGTTRAVVRAAVQWLATYLEANWAGRVQGVQLAESATSLNGASYWDRTLYWQEIMYLIDLWIQYAPSIPIGVGINYSPGGLFGTYNLATDTWSSSFYDPIFKFFVSRAPNLVITYPDHVACYYTGTNCTPNQRQYRDMWIANHPEMPSIASNDLYTDEPAATCQQRWACAQNDPIAPDVADYHIGIYGDSTWNRPRSNVYHSVRYGYRGYNAHNDAQYRTDHALAIAETPLNAWNTNDIESGEPPPPTPQTLSVLAVNCGAAQDYLGTGGITHRADNLAFNAGAHTVSSVPDAIANTPDQPLYKSSRTLQAAATTPMVFRPENMGLTLEDGTDWFLVIGKSNNSPAPFNNRVSTATLYIDGAPTVLYSEQNDLLQEPATFTAFDQTFGPFTLGPNIAVRLEFSKGTPGAGIDTVNPSIKRFSFFRGADPEEATPGEPGPITGVQIIAISADGADLVWNPTTITPAP